MEYRINKPKIPVIWLDTHAICQIGTALFKPTNDPENVYRREQYTKLVELRKANKIFSFESDQLTEIEVRPELVKKSTDVLVHTSQGIRTHYHHPEQMQFQIAIKSHINKDQHPEIDWQTAFLGGNPFRDRAVGGFFVRARFDPSSEEVQERKRSNKAIAEEWEKLRIELVKQKMPEKDRYELQRQRELTAGQKIFLDTLAKSTAQQISGIQPSDDEFWTSLHLVGLPATLWQQHGGKDGTKGILKFYGSDYYKNSPYISISSSLISQKIVIGEPIKPSDVMDIKNISAFLPYCTHMVLDRAMINAVKKLGLDSLYGVKVLRLSEIGDILDDL